jgi:glutamate-ammonia-ligase adenylyltransferase
MTLLSEIRIHPVPHDVILGDTLLNDLGDTPVAASDLIKGIGGCSPYLSSLLRKERDWIADQWNADPYDSFNGILASAANNSGDVGTRLRQAKRRVALLLGLCDLGGVWNLEEITKLLTDFADFAVQTSLQSLVVRAVELGKLPDEIMDDPTALGGMFVIAMGKMGAHELNYSSDIDLIVLFDDSQFDMARTMELRAEFIKITRAMVKILSDVTDDGYVFRTDLRLRPNPSVTPVCFGAEAALNYYEAEGRPWERTAMIKARICAGDQIAGAKFLKSLHPFVWRRSLDFTALAEAQDIMQKIRSHKGIAGQIEIAGHNLKLGRGGIREIEFFAQTNQMIAGGRNPKLRSIQTVKALRAQAEEGWIDPHTCTVLVEGYRELRRQEHRLQMLRDFQTHIVPKDKEKLSQFAAFCGAQNEVKFFENLKYLLIGVHNHTDTVLGQKETKPHQELTDDHQDLVETWYQLPALKSPKAVALFNGLRPKLFAALDKATDSDAAVKQFDRFIRGLPAGVQLFSLFDSNPNILDLLVDICGSAPTLADYLTRNTSVFDAVISPDFYEPLPDVGGFTDELTVQLEPLNDFEDMLNATRRWNKEHRFRIGVQFLRQMITPQEAGQNYTNLAQATVAVLLDVVIGEFSKKYGPPVGNGLVVLAMGKLGSGEMTASSDLDLIVIYDADGIDMSTGPKPLFTRQYFARLTQLMITALSAPMSEGELYEVDLRLRPSGRKGPVATSIESFEAYQKTEAWIWEHLALSRAGVIAGDAHVVTRVEAIRREVLSQKHDQVAVFDAVKEMRIKLAQTKGQGTDVWSLKEQAGGMLDIELLAQALCLIYDGRERTPVSQLQECADKGGIHPDIASALIEVYKLLANLQYCQRLMFSDKIDAENIGHGSLLLLLSVGGRDSMIALEDRIKNAVALSNEHITALLNDA